MPTVIIDTNPLTSDHKGRGVGTYTRELVKSLQDVAGEWQINTSDEAQGANADLIHYPYFDLFFPTLSVDAKVPVVVTIHDVIPLLFPKFFPSGIRGRINFVRQLLSLRQVAHIITDSNSSKRDITTHLHIPESKITSIALGGSESFKPVTQKVVEQVSERYKLPKRYWLYVGDINYNKNLPGLITAVNKVNKLPLVIVTRARLSPISPEKQTALAQTMIHQAMAQLSSPNLVQFISVDSSQDLNAVYTGATAYIQPSWYEGFGLPILEAMASGTVVISSDQGSLPEVGGESVVYFDPHQSDQLTEAMHQVLSYSKTDRDNQVSHQRTQANNFTWQRTAQETLKVYQHVLSEKYPQ